MGLALLPLLAKWAISLRKLLLQILNPTFISNVLDRLLRCIVLWAILVRPKPHPRRDAIDGPQKDNITTSKGTEATATSLKQQDPTYTIVRNGDSVSLNGAALSSYPFSTNGIRSSRSSANSRQSRSRSRDASATRSSHRSSIHEHSPSRLSHHAPSFNDYPHSFHGSNDATGSAPAVRDRIYRPFRDPQRQHSKSLSDLQIPDLSPINSNIPRSPPPHLPTLQYPSSAVEIISPSSSVDTPSPANINELDGKGSYEPRIQKESSRTESPTPSIQLVGPVSPVEVVSPIDYDARSLNIPLPTGRSSRASPSENNASSLFGFNPEVMDISSESEQDDDDDDDDEDTIDAVMSDTTKRWKRRTKIQKVHVMLTVPPLTTVYRDKRALPPGWFKHVHPEGIRYFHHPEKNIFTDSNIYDPVLHERIMDDAFRLERKVKALDISLPPGHMLMIDVAHKKKYPDQFIVQYYYVDPVERVIFFAHPYDTREMGTGTWEIFGPKSLCHLEYEMRAQYWYFMMLYPTALTLTQEMVCEFRDSVLYFIGDSMTSPFSTSPYKLEDLRQLLSLADAIEKNVGSNHLGTITMFARNMFIFEHNKFQNFYGESFARVERNFSVFGDPIYIKTWLVKTLSPILFSAPDVHLRNLQNMWVDGILHKSVWEESIKKLNDEWQEFVFFATVMLTSNVGFLAIQSVDIDMGPMRSPAQIASYLSVVMNVGSIILGLLLMRQNRTKNRETCNDVQLFLRERNHHMLGLETLAVLYSLPYALLMWGVVAFLVAFCCIFFETSTSQTRGLVGSLCIAVAALVFWCIATSWEGKVASENRNHDIQERHQALEETEAEIYEPAFDQTPNLSSHFLGEAIRQNLPRLTLTLASISKYHRSSTEFKHTNV